MTAKRLILIYVLLPALIAFAQDPVAPSDPNVPDLTDPSLDIAPLDTLLTPGATPTLEPGKPATPRDTTLLRQANGQHLEKVFSQRELGFEDRRIGATQSVRITLEYSPQILLQDTEVKSREGATRVAQGEFDTHVTGQAQADLRQRNRNETARPINPAPSPYPTPFPNPLVRRTNLYEFELGLRQKLRNGVVLEPKVAFRPSTDKDYDQTFNNTNEGAVSFDVFIPLAKGGGRLVNEAPEISARFDLLASVLQLRYLTSQSVRDTMQAYWRCRSAEERYKLFVESENISLRLVKLSASLVEADELAPAQLAQILADRNTTTAARISSESDLILARQRLAIAMGFSPESLTMAPLTADPFPELPRNQAYPDLNDLWFTALNLRDDLRAARQLEKSRKVLMDASFLELRPRIDLQLRATYLPFETRTNVNVTRGSEYGGFAAMSLDWPIQNNSAIGSYIQNTAAYDRSQIDVEDLKRTIVSGVISSLAELRSADAQVRRYAEAARFNAEALQAQEDLFRLGQANLTDTITTRQRLIQSQLDYVGAKERYAVSLVQLRFETGLIFFSDAKGDWIDAKAWQIVPLLNAGGKK